MKIHYLEVVTHDIESTCKTYSHIHNIEFGEADLSLGGARTATFENGSLLGVRAPLRDTETPTVRHYLLVEDIQKTVDEAEKLGAQIAVPPMPLPGHGQCAIIIQNGIEIGYWQV